MTPVEHHVLKRFMNLYGPPDTNDFASFSGEYTKALGQIDSKRLEQAINRVVESHCYKSWPTPGECVAAARAVAATAERLNELRNYKPEPERRDAHSAASKARVDEMAAKAIASLRAVGETGQRSDPPPRVDRAEWEKRQAGLAAAGKWSLNTASESVA